MSGEVTEMLDCSAVSPCQTKRQHVQLSCRMLQHKACNTMVIWQEQGRHQMYQHKTAVPFSVHLCDQAQEGAPSLSHKYATAVYRGLKKSTVVYRGSAMGGVNLITPTDVR